VAYTYEQLLAVDPSNPANVARAASITIFAPGDATKTPLTITDTNGAALPNPLTSNANGFAPAFIHATLDRVAWEGGGLTGFLTSYEGMKEEAVEARAAAEGAASDAAAAQAAAEAAAADVLHGNPDLTVTYNADGTVATTTEDGVLTTFTYTADGTVDTQTRAGITKTFTYDANGNVTGAA
jgi:YD repeat-containing protein